MASIINASTSGAGGVITTADASGELQIQSAGSTVATVTGSGVAVTGTLSSSGAISSSSTVAGATGTLYPLVSGTVVASTSGTSIDFTGIPSWVKRITVMFNVVSTNGTSIPLVQLGDSGGIETTGYISISTSLQNAFSIATSSSNAGFHVFSGSASGIIIGPFVITNVSGNLWVASFNGVNQGFTSGLLSAGNKTLSDVLTQVRITTTNGTDAFDAGSINILYE